MTDARLPLFRSSLPTAEKVFPYLKEIDVNRQHTSFGPLQTRLIGALEKHLGTGTGTVVLTANGSLGLLHAINASDIEAGGLVALPSWTFAATPAAVFAAGLTPWFLDVDESTWALDPDRVQAALADAPGPVAAVLPVAPFGSPADIAAWDAFHDATGLPVVIDAANGFDALRAGRSPTMVSLHATKAFGVGEGGFVVSSDRELISRLRDLTNYGVNGTGMAELRGFNAKLSEYTAAIGLAGLDDWPETRDAYAALKRGYADALVGIPGIAPALGLDHDWVTSTFNVVLPGEAGVVVEALDERGIEARRWWADGCHRLPAYTDCPRQDLLVTERLAARVLSLPFFLGMEAADVRRVVDGLRDILGEPG